jgi:hypothetical protein
MPMEMFPALKHHTRAADQTDSSLQLQTIGRLFQSFSSRITDTDTIKYDLDNAQCPSLRCSQNMRFKLSVALSHRSDERLQITCLFGSSTAHVYSHIYPSMIGITGVDVSSWTARIICSAHGHDISSNVIGLAMTTTSFSSKPFTKRSSDSLLTCSLLLSRDGASRSSRLNVI